MDKASQKCAEKLHSDVLNCLGILSNEPSKGLYYVHIHWRRSQKSLVACKQNLSETTGKVREAEEPLSECIAETSKLGSELVQSYRNINSMIESATAFAEVILALKSKK